MDKRLGHLLLEKIKFVLISVTVKITFNIKTIINIEKSKNFFADVLKAEREYCGQNKYLNYNGYGAVW